MNAPLMGSLMVVVVRVVLGDRSDFFQGAGTLYAQALIFVRTMIALHKSVQLRMPGRADVGLNANAEQEAGEGRRRIACAGAPDPPGIAIKGEPVGKTISAQKGDHAFKGGLCMKISMNLSIQQDGGGCIHKIEHLDGMLLFALGIGSNGGGILKIHLNILQGIRQIPGTGGKGARIKDHAMLAQQPLDGSCGARQAFARMQAKKHRDAGNTARL